MPSKNSYSQLEENIKYISENTDFFGNNYADVLGLVEGICFGLVYMWGQRVLAAWLLGKSKTLNLFYKRLELLTTDFQKKPLYYSSKNRTYYWDTVPNLLPKSENKEDKKFTQLSEALKHIAEQIKQEFSPITKKITHTQKFKRNDIAELLLSVRPFLDGLLFYQNPHLTTLGEQEGIGYQSVLKTSPYVTNQAIEKINSDGESLPLKQIYSRPFVLNTTPLCSNMLMLLLNKMHSSKVPFFVVFDSHGHTIGLTCQANGERQIFDTDYMSLGNDFFENFLPQDIDGCIRYLISRFDFGKKLHYKVGIAVNISVWLRPGDNTEIFSKPIVKESVDKKERDYLMQPLQEYTQKSSWGRSGIKHKGRAKYNIEQLKTMTLFQAAEFLEEELCLQKNKTDQRLHYKHYKQNRVIKDNDNCYIKKVEETYQRYIQHFLGLSYYIKNYLPDIIKNQLACKTLFLYIACKEGHVDVVKLLLENPNKVNVNQATPKSWTALHIACQEGYVDIVKLLLENSNKVNVNQATPDGRTALLLACDNGYVDVAKRLLENSKVREKVNEAMTNGYTPLMLTCLRGHVDVVKLLLANPNKVNVNQATSDGYTSLMLACDNGYVDVVTLLLKNSKVREKVNQATTDGYTPLMLTCLRGHVDVVKLLLANPNKVNVNQATPKGSTPLMRACSKGHADVVKLLLENSKVREKVNQATTDGLTALHIACQEGYVDIVKLLLQVPSISMKPDRDGVTLLIQACGSAGKVDILKMLLKKIHPSELNQTADGGNLSGLSPIIQAAFSVNESILFYLLRNYYSLINLKQKFCYRNEPNKATNVLGWYQKQGGKNTRIKAYLSGKYRYSYEEYKVYRRNLE